MLAVFFLVIVMYTENDFRAYELYHHGILGQKWGKKQGPPYPLDPSEHSASEKKAGWRKSLDKDVDSTIKTVKRLRDDVKTVSDSSKSSKESKEAAKDIGKTRLKVAGGVVGAKVVGNSLGGLAAAVGLTATVGTMGLAAVPATALTIGAKAIGIYSGYKVGYALTSKIVDKKKR